MPGRAMQWDSVLKIPQTNQPTSKKTKNNESFTYGSSFIEFENHLHYLSKLNIPRKSQTLLDWMERGEHKNTQNKWATSKTEARFTVTRKKKMKTAETRNLESLWECQTQDIKTSDCWMDTKTHTPKGAGANTQMLQRSMCLTHHLKNMLQKWIGSSE